MAVWRRDTNRASVALGAAGRVVGKSWLRTAEFQFVAAKLRRYSKALHFLYPLVRVTFIRSNGILLSRSLNQYYNGNIFRSPKQRVLSITGPVQLIFIMSSSINQYNKRDRAIRASTRMYVRTYVRMKGPLCKNGYLSPSSKMNPFIPRVITRYLSYFHALPMPKKDDERAWKERERKRVLQTSGRQRRRREPLGEKAFTFLF